RNAQDEQGDGGGTRQAGQDTGHGTQASDAGIDGGPGPGVAHAGAKVPERTSAPSHLRTLRSYLSSVPFPASIFATIALIRPPLPSPLTAISGTSFTLCSPRIVASWMAV